MWVDQIFILGLIPFSHVLNNCERGVKLNKKQIVSQGINVNVRKQEYNILKNIIILGKRICDLDGPDVNSSSLQLLFV